MSWQQVKIGSFLKRIKRPVKVDVNSEYKLVTIRINHNGVSLRETKRGSDLKSNMYEVKEGDFILSGIDARNGAFGIIPKELDGALVTNDFWYFDIDESVIDKHFFLELTSTNWFDEICKRGSDGTTQRIRLQKDKFFNQIITLPKTMAFQKELLLKTNKVKTKQIELSNEISLQKDYLAKLKQSILQDAIRGKLTEDWRAENGDVEPASELLKRIKAEKQQMIKDGKIRKEKPLEPINESELPFSISPTWQWCRLSSLYKSTSGGTPSRSNSKFWHGDITWYKSGELNDGILDCESDENITIEGLNGSSATMFPNGTLLIAMYGATAGKLSILKRIATTNQAVCGIFENIHIETEYLFYYLMSQRQKMINDSWGMSQPNISQTYLKAFIIPVPPYEEQKRIVEIIKESLEKCSLIEAQITANEITAQNLLKSILSETFNNN